MNERWSASNFKVCVRERGKEKALPSVYGHGCVFRKCDGVNNTLYLHDVGVGLCTRDNSLCVLHRVRNKKTEK